MYTYIFTIAFTVALYYAIQYIIPVNQYGQLVDDVVSNVS